MILFRIFSRSCCIFCCVLFCIDAFQSNSSSSLIAKPSHELRLGSAFGYSKTFSTLVRYSDPEYGSIEPFPVSWDGASFQEPIYYGYDISYWMPNQFGFMLEFIHAKIKADPLPEGFSLLEMTDGLNYLTLNALHRSEPWDWLYIEYGGGLGISIPHVEVIYRDRPRTYEYQATGPVFQAILGLEFKIPTNHFWGKIWRLRTNYKLSYSYEQAKLNGGARLSTHLFTNHVSFGLVLAFDLNPN